ncbi:MAG: TIGR03620 family F420-dependent LLM class oxidoreductase [Actinobacteria bacterium]|nr:TIGR03620 family F420-dependent LLM class oxidoreductase [Actinomycetota bacterium]
MDVGRVGIWSPSPAWEASDELEEAAAELDELGYGALWLGGARGDLALPARLLAATRGLVIATAIVNVWTDPAGEVAARYADLEAREPDRLLIGLGSSHAPLVEPAGFSYRRPLHRLAGYLDELDAGDPTIAADRRVLGALGPKALTLAAGRSAGAHPYLVTPGYTRQARARIGPDPLLAVEQKAVLEADPRRARQIARARLAQYLRLPNYTNSFLRQGFTEADFERGGSDRLVDGLVAWGDVATVLGRVAEHHAAGADHVALQVLDSPDYRPTNPLPRGGWRLLAAGLRETVGAPR